MYWANCLRVTLREEMSGKVARAVTKSIVNGLTELCVVNGLNEDYS